MRAIREFPSDIFNTECGVRIAEPKGDGEIYQLSCRLALFRRVGDRRAGFVPPQKHSK
jgi:hypothetical protein